MLRVRDPEKADNDTTKQKLQGHPKEGEREGVCSFLLAEYLDNVKLALLPPLHIGTINLLPPHMVYGDITIGG